MFVLFFALVAAAAAAPLERRDVITPPPQVAGAPAVPSDLWFKDAGQMQPYKKSGLFSRLAKKIYNPAKNNYKNNPKANFVVNPNPRDPKNKIDEMYAVPKVKPEPIDALYAGPAVGQAKLNSKDGKVWQPNKIGPMPPSDSAYQMNSYLNSLAIDSYADLDENEPDLNALSQAQRVSDFRTSLVENADINV